jgi:DNA-binding response OmpR family regulator
LVGAVSRELRRKLLIVDDDSESLGLLAAIVELAGFAALPAQDPPTALETFEREQPDAVLLDLMLGPSDGLDLLRKLRRRPYVPVLILTARGGENDRVRGLELGADDYIVKPFSVRELIARIRVHTRRDRADRGNGGTLKAGPLTLDVDQHSVKKDGESLHLTVSEFKLLHHLMSRAGHVVRTSVLAKEVWGYEDDGARDVVRVTLHRLRRKLGEDGSNPRLLQTVPGVGVIMLTPNGSESASL